jgi:hypothetical protein
MSLPHIDTQRKGEKFHQQELFCRKIDPVQGPPKAGVAGQSFGFLRKI